MKISNPTYNIFISYPSSELVIVTQFYEILTNLNYNVFLDTNSLQCGDKWREQITKAQKRSSITLILISEESAKSHYQQEEIILAIELMQNSNHKIIPIYYISDKSFKEIIPFGLHSIQGIIVQKDSISSFNNGCIKLKKLLQEQIRNPKGIKLKSKSSFYSGEEFIFQKDPHFKEKAAFNFTQNLSAFFNSQLFTTIFNSTMIYVDIDRFGAINQKYGNICGDTVISEILQIMHLAFNRENEINNNVFINRICGDQFVICLLNFSDDLIQVYTNNLLNNIRTYNWDSVTYSLFVTVSIGVAKIIVNKRIVDSSDMDFNPLINESMQRSMACCQICKRQGGNIINYAPAVTCSNLVSSYNWYYDLS
ncbi:MAG TPA: TIR domain-containing protein [Bacteroidales bacterium]|nr:TIR domain-containing protein [Bacteroidales bacterium]